MRGNNIGEYVTVLLIVFFLITFSYAVIKTASEIQENVQPTNRTKELNETNHLPTKCRKYYQSEDDSWVECMGVGYK